MIVMYEKMIHNWHDQYMYLTLVGIEKEEENECMNLVH